MNKNTPSRRDFLSQAALAGAAAGAGALLPQWAVAAEKAGGSPKPIQGKADSCIFIWLGGGACVVVAALWKTFLALRPKPPGSTDGGKPGARADTGVAGGGDVNIGGNVTITRSATPAGLWLLAAAGLALLAVAIFGSGDTTNVTNGAVNNGDMTDSRIEVTTHGGTE